jgi:hypothetical protein
MDHPHEKHTKVGHDDVGTSKRGHKFVTGRRSPPQDSPPLDQHEDEEPKPLKMHEPEKTDNWVYIKYSKKIYLTTLTGNREALVYVGQRMCTNQHFWSFFHADWYRWCTSRRSLWWRPSG